MGGEGQRCVGGVRKAFRKRKATRNGEKTPFRKVSRTEMTPVRGPPVIRHPHIPPSHRHSPAPGASKMDLCITSRISGRGATVRSVGEPRAPHGHGQGQGQGQGHGQGEMDKEKEKEKDMDMDMDGAMDGVQAKPAGRRFGSTPVFTQ